MAEATQTAGSAGGLGQATARDYGRGAALLSVGIGITGLVTFAFFFIASHALPEKEYGGITLLWSAVFIVVTVLYRPVEQLLARSVAENDVTGTPHGRTLRIAGSIQLGLGVLFAIVALAARGAIQDDLFSGSETLYWILIASVPAYAVSYFTRGLLAGTKRFGLYGVLVFMEATSRVMFPLAVIVGLLDGQGWVAAGILAGPILSLAVVPWALARRARSVAKTRASTVAAEALAASVEPDSRPPASGKAEAEFTLANGAGFATAALLIMLCEQTFMNAGPLIIKATSDRDGAALAGFVFNVLLIARAPLQLFQSVATSLLPHLAGLRASGGEDSYRRSIQLTVMAVGAFSGLVALTMLIAGPSIMDLLFGSKFDYDRLGLVLVALGMGAYLAAATLNQSALAARQTGKATACWLVSATVFVVWLLLPAIDDKVLRVEVGFIGAAALLCGLLAALYRSAAPRAAKNAR